MQIRTVDSLGVPANSILATEQIDNISQTTFPAINPVSVAFDPPPILQIGQIYALVMTGSTRFLRFMPTHPAIPAQMAGFSRTHLATGRSIQLTTTVTSSTT